MVVGFNVRPNAEARQLADREGVEIRTYRVIYQLTEDIEQALVGMLKPVETEETLGEAEVRETFRASRVGTIAGCMVTSGVIRRNAQVRVIRDGTVVYETTIDSLKRFQDDAREVTEGFECGIHLANYDDVKVGDVLEAYETRQVERTDLSDGAAPAASSPYRGGPCSRPARTTKLARAELPPLVGPACAASCRSSVHARYSSIGPRARRRMPRVEIPARERVPLDAHRPRWLRRSREHAWERRVRKVRVPCSQRLLIRSRSLVSSRASPSRRPRSSGGRRVARAPALGARQRASSTYSSTLTERRVDPRPPPGATWRCPRAT